MDDMAEEQQEVNVADQDLARAPVPLTNDGEVGGASTLAFDVDLTSGDRSTHCVCLISSQSKEKNSIPRLTSHRLTRPLLPPYAGARILRMNLFCSLTPA